MITNYPKNGKDGITPHIGSNNNWFIGNEDTGIRASAQATTEVVEITLVAANWDTDTLQQAVPCEGVLSDDDKQIITIIPPSEIKDKYDDCSIECVSSAQDSLTFTAKTIPDEDMLIYIALETVGSRPVANTAYSTEETVVGTWIDGKPIYRTTIVATAPTSSNNSTQAESTIDVSHLSVDLSVDISGIMIEPTPSHIAINSVSNFSSDFGIAVFYISTNQVLKIRHKCAAWSGAPMYINFEYTKTTDTATVAIPSATALAEAYEEGVNEA